MLHQQSLLTFALMDSDPFIEPKLDDGGPDQSLRPESGPSDDASEQATFSRCLTKGDILLRCLDLDEADAATQLRAAGYEIGQSLTSAFDQPNELEESGWRKSRPSWKLDERPEMEAAFQDLGISRALEHHEQSAWVLDSKSMTDQVMSGSLGVHQALHVPVDGTMVVSQAWSPEKTRARLIERGFDFKGEELPALRRWSDFAYLAYLQSCQSLGCEVSGIRHIFMHDIVNDTTRAVAGWILRDCDMRVLSWERRRCFAPDSDEGKALLGSPSGYGVLWMLLTQPALRHLTVVKVCIFGGRPEERTESGMYIDEERPRLYIGLGDKP